LTIVLLLSQARKKRLRDILDNYRTEKDAKGIIDMPEPLRAILLQEFERRRRQ